MWIKIKAFLNKVIHNDVVVRSFKTFVQTAGAYVIVNLAGVDFFANNGENFLVGLLLSAGSAGLSAVWNGVIAPLLKKQ